MISSVARERGREEEAKRGRIFKFLLDRATLKSVLNLPRATLEISTVHVHVHAYSCIYMYMYMYRYTVSTCCSVTTLESYLIASGCDLSFAFSKHGKVPGKSDMVAF